MHFLLALESILTWLLSYPLLPLQVALFLLIAWGRLGYGMGADDLFWSERIWEQALNGLACGLLFGEILLVRYLLMFVDDPGRGPPFCFPISLFPVEDRAINHLGQYLAIFWTLSLLALWGFKLLSPDVRGGELRIWPLAVGLALAMILVTVGVMALVRLGLLPVLTTGPLHGAAGTAAVLFTLALAIVYVAHFCGAVLSPILVVCVLLGFANAVYGFLAFHWPGSQYVALLVLVVAGLLTNSRWISGDTAYKLRFPGLTAEYDHPRRIDEEAEADGQGGWKRTDHYYSLLRAQAADPKSAPDLIRSDEPLRKLKERWQNQHGPGSKPKIVIVCPSGGGIRAAVWTAVVLEGLEADMPPGFRDHIRLFTGASGGMVGAGLYVADFENPSPVRTTDPETGLSRLAGLLARDSLRRTVQTMTLIDFPSLWWPGAMTWDRGQEIERVWAESTASAAGDSPFRKTFAQLKDLERDGRRPSLVYSPMLVEDARRLLISNLDLLDLTWASGDVAGFDSFRKRFDVPNGPDRPLLSLSAVELFRLFPTAPNSFQVGTAARMNASFPLVSPGVSLPTNPPRRTVDAGYYDNFGVNLAAMWVLRNEQAIREHTSGVAVVEIRAYRNGYARWHFQNQEAEKYVPDPEVGGTQTARRDQGALEAALEWLATPVEAINSARTRAAYYRNDELLDLLSNRLNAGQAGFFTTLAFECEVDAALSWTLPTAEARRIARAYHGDPDADDRKARYAIWTKNRVKALKEWFGTGGR